MKIHLFDSVTDLRATIGIKLFFNRVVFLCLSGMVTVQSVVAAESGSGGNGNSILVPMLMVVGGTLVVAAVAIWGMVYWGHRQDHLGEMVHFCLKFLMDSEEEEERSASAQALGQAKDPGVFLVLLDVALDEGETPGVRMAAAESLHEMGVRVRRYKEILPDLEQEIEHENYPGIIAILVANFEQGDRVYPQCAYLIGRLYMRMGLYVDARDWLIKAIARNQRYNVYGTQIRKMLRTCNVHLLQEADDAFRNADYLRSKERYAALDHDLDDAERKRCSLHLRMACVFMQLKDYLNADQSLLQALAKRHATDLALTLVPLLQKVQETAGDNAASEEQGSSAKQAADKRANEIMAILLMKKF